MKKKLLGIIALLLLFCSTALAASLPSKHIETLDLFLAKLESYQSNSNYVQVLDSFLAQLNALKPRYNSRGNVPAMIDYLVSGVESLKNKKLATDIDDEFFRNISEVLSGGGLGSTSSSSSGGNTNDNGGYVGTSSSGGSTSSSSTTSGSSTSSSGGSTSSSSGGSTTTCEYSINGSTGIGKLNSSCKGHEKEIINNSGYAGGLHANEIVKGTDVTYEYVVKISSSNTAYYRAYSNKLKVCPSGYIYYYTKNDNSPLFDKDDYVTFCIPESYLEKSVILWGDWSSCVNGKQTLSSPKVIQANLEGGTPEGNGYHVRNPVYNNNYNYNYNPEIINKLKTRACHEYSWNTKSDGEVACKDNTSQWTGIYDEGIDKLLLGNVPDKYCTGAKPSSSTTSPSSSGGSSSTSSSTSSSSSSTSSSGGNTSLTSVCTKGFTYQNQTETDYYFNSCGATTKQKDIRSAYVAAGREPEYDGLVAWNKSPYTGEIIKCAIRKGMTTEAESIKTKAKSLYDNSTCATICNTKEFDNGNSSEVEYYFNSCNASAKETEVRSIYVAAGREPDYEGLKYRTASIYVADVLKCRIRKGLMGEPEPMKTKATNLFNSTTICKLIK